MRTAPNAFTTVLLRAPVRRLAAAGLCMALLAGCSTTKNTADAADGQISQAAGEANTAGAKGILAKGGTTASRKYVDPYVTAGAGQTQAQNQVATDAEASSGAANSASIAGLSTQPTGVRAGNFSIFSSAQAPGPASAAAGASASTPETTGSVPLTGRVNAATTSVFSSPQPVPAAGCGTDTNGAPLSC